jgi:delta24(24(1))-sterol reductase
MSLTWGAIIGTTTIIPYFYSMFFIVVLLHRCTRDFERCVVFLLHYSENLTQVISLSSCSIKYGKDWERYCAVVKYKYIPGIY